MGLARTIWDNYFSVPTIKINGTELPLRQVLNLIGSAGQAVDNDAEGQTDITLGGGATPGGSLNSVQFHGASGFDGATRVSIADGRLALAGTAGGAFATTGDVRIAAGGLDGNGFSERWLGVDPADGVTPCNVFSGYVYASSATGNVQGLCGDWDYPRLRSKCPDIVYATFNDVISFEFSNLTPQGDVAGMSLTSWARSSPVSGWEDFGGFPQRRLLWLHRGTNFVLAGYHDHLWNPEDALGFGEGVMGIGYAEVDPTTNPIGHVTLWHKQSDGYLYYRKPDGEIIKITNGEVNTTSNLGSGVGLAAAKSGPNLPLKSLVAGSGVSIASSATEVTISSTVVPGEANTTSNVGSGAGLAKAKVGTDLPLKSIVAGSGVSVTPNTNDVTIACTVVPGETNTTSNTGAGAQVAKAKSGVDFPHRTFVAQGGAAVVQQTDTIEVYGNGLAPLSNGSTGTQNDVATTSGGVNVSAIRFGGGTTTVTGLAGGIDGRRLVLAAAGGPVTLAHDDTGSTAANRISTSTSANVTIPQGASALLAYDSTSQRWRLAGMGVAPGEVNTTSNTGTGAQVAKAKSGVDFPMRSLTGAGRVTVTQNANDIAVGYSENDDVITMASANRTIAAGDLRDFLRFTGTLGGVTRNVTLPIPGTGAGYSLNVTNEINEDAGILFTIGSGKTAHLRNDAYPRATLSVTSAGVFVTGALKPADVSSMSN